MKTAIIISGAQRYQHLGMFRTLTQFTGFDEVDIFVRVWKSPEFASTASELINLWQSHGLPKSWNFARVEVLDDQPPHHPPYMPLNLAEWAPNFLTMWWGIVKSNELRKAYEAQFCVNYDLVFRLRTDAWINTPDVIINLQDLVEPAKNTMFISNNHSDIIHITSPAIYDQFVNYWQHLKTLSVNWEFVHPEESLIKYFEQKNINYQTLPMHSSAHRSGKEYGVRPGDW